MMDNLHSYLLELLRRVGFAHVELLHKNKCFAAFGVRGKNDALTDSRCGALNALAARVDGFE